MMITAANCIWLYFFGNFLLLLFLFLHIHSNNTIIQLLKFQVRSTANILCDVYV